MAQLPSDGHAVRLLRIGDSGFATHQIDRPCVEALLGSVVAGCAHAPGQAFQLVPPERFHRSMCVTCTAAAPAEYRVDVVWECGFYAEGYSLRPGQLSHFLRAILGFLDHQTDTVQQLSFFLAVPVDDCFFEDPGALQAFLCAHAEVCVPSELFLRAAARALDAPRLLHMLLSTRPAEVPAQECAEVLIGLSAAASLTCLFDTPGLCDRLAFDRLTTSALRCDSPSCLGLVGLHAPEWDSDLKALCASACTLFKPGAQGHQDGASDM